MVPIQCGDVVLAGLPFVQDFTQTQKRPVLVVQNNAGNRFSSNTIVLAISSQPPAKDHLFHFRIPANSDIGRAVGLIQDSVV
ncbi:type II toxin-antitoxin system PemK/MazF family toxin [candidate division KSB1 bacterium]|nr:MAG: type II toxin-antitoxin system PemK/MazF family toxin [candidate division KSB1 bacterium]MBC6951638.1 type II toxin-antitoxin system PemK/MazF family toxin [candidate division KSB1 bacterium]MCE7941841.1 type II toxin-antitoxin system PemK/MazF family toxin [Chlorobi bacterium CHB1]MDL1878802.1 type II toxin-antitoxin system PemK/MazF family toxin [Cytophagia bacterium CHB2]